MKNVYLLVTDLHLDFSKANRINYFGEVLNAMNDIVLLADQYREKGYTVNQCILGDMFDGSLSNASEAMQAIEIFRYYCSNFENSWAVVGNHEISYAQDNPFWFLVSDIKDASLAGIQRFIQPRGLTNTLVIPDTIIDGEVTFYFNHFGTRAKTPDASGIKIGLFHQNVGSNDICKMWGTFDNVEEAAYIQAYNYCYFGHMHLAKGKYYLNENHTCFGEWLGTIGRTKVDEVLVDDKVNIPAIVIEDGKFVRIDDNYITLPPPVECIDFVKLRASQNSRKIIEERKVFAQTAYKGATLFETMEGVCTNTPLDFLLHFLDQPWDDVLRAYNETLKHPGLAEEPVEVEEEVLDVG